MDSRVLGSYTGLAPYKCLVLMGYRKRTVDTIFNLLYRILATGPGFTISAVVLKYPCLHVRPQHLFNTYRPKWGLNNPMWLVLTWSVTHRRTVLL
ncbi:Sterol regulatory element-binding protein ECM22 [Fusarium oxysporum f. sp. albedinis]|nr:Sterol regulatory element-binding protein ECM22 [Fusarium oxysporum f. sp. albedinis]